MDLLRTTTREAILSISRCLASVAGGTAELAVQHLYSRSSKTVEALRNGGNGAFKLNADANRE
jgi:ApbE superfamily uncharacterized protein (UPF0280 family)